MSGRTMTYRRAAVLLRNLYGRAVESDWTTDREDRALAVAIELLTAQGDSDALPAPRLKYGDQTACVTCEMDVQWCGSPFRRVLIPARDGRPAVTMTDGGWIGRGGDRFCDQSGAVVPDVDGDGDPARFPHRLHRGAR